MEPDDASSADMRPRSADPLALDDDTAERLLTGSLPPSQVPRAYAKVAELLAAAAAPPSPGEVAGQEVVLAELRAKTRARPPVTTLPRTAARPRRRRTGLAVVVVTGALVTGGVAGAATGHLKGPVREAARTVLGTAGGRTPASTRGVPPPAPDAHPTGAGGAGPRGTRPGATTNPGPGASAAAPAPAPNLKGLCQAYANGVGRGQVGAMEATAFQALARAAGGDDQVPAFCKDLLPGEWKLEVPKDDKAPKDPGDPEPSGQDRPGRGR
jgi:hypothetical protein